MKKVRSFLAIVCSLAIVGCGAPAGNTAPADTGSTEAVTEEATATEETAEAPAEEEKPASIIPDPEPISLGSNPDTVYGSDPIPVPEFAAVDLPDSEALAFTRSLGMGWNLGNTFDAIDCSLSDEMQYESSWVGVKTDEKHIQTIQDAGFKTIRFPASWHNHVDENYKISEQWLDRYQEVVDWAYNRGMYVIVNIHHDNNQNYMYPSYEKLEQSIKYVTTIWEQLADRFADYDTHLIFESLNEPRHVGTDHEWWLSSTTTGEGAEAVDCINQLNQAIVDTIRANGKGYNKERYIMVPGYCGSPNFCTVDSFVVPDDSNATAENRILISAHSYSPYSFALDQGGTDEFSISENKGTGDIEGVMKMLYNKYTSKGIGVVMGEFASLNKNNIEARTEHAAYYAACASHYGIPCVLWDNNNFIGAGEKLGMLMRAKNTIEYPEIVDQLIYYSLK